MERLNSKYNLDCFPDSELDSESDKGEQYQYETQVWDTYLKRVPKCWKCQKFLQWYHFWKVTYGQNFWKL